MSITMTVSARQVTSGYLRASLSRQPQQPAIEVIHMSHPCLRNCQRHEAELRFATHRGDVTEATREALVSDKRRRSVFATEVNALNHEVRCQQEIFVRTSRPIDRAVIANTEHKLSVHSGYAAAQALDRLNFTHAIHSGSQMMYLASEPEGLLLLAQRRLI